MESAKFSYDKKTDLLLRYKTNDPFYFFNPFDLEGMIYSRDKVVLKSITVSIISASRDSSKLANDLKMAVVSIKQIMIYCVDKLRCISYEIMLICGCVPKYADGIEIYT